LHNTQFIEMCFNLYIYYMLIGWHFLVKCLILEKAEYVSDTSNVVV
jgi:hypothetical protein